MIAFAGNYTPDSGDSFWLAEEVSYANQLMEEINTLGEAADILNQVLDGV